MYLFVYVYIHILASFPGLPMFVNVSRETWVRGYRHMQLLINQFSCKNLPTVLCLYVMPLLRLANHVKYLQLLLVHIHPFIMHRQYVRSLCIHTISCKQLYNTYIKCCHKDCIDGLFKDVFVPRVHYLIKQCKPCLPIILCVAQSPFGVYLGTN